MTRSSHGNATNGNINLHSSRTDKADEFYTDLSLIESELKHYKKHFANKSILCNCDDPFESNFFKYFAANFNELKLKKLIATCYASSPISYGQLNLFDEKNEPSSAISSKRPYRIIITEVKDENGDGRIDIADVEYLIKNKKNTLELLEGDGDFRSIECTNFLKEADIVVTNPPFSLFREYVALLLKYQKQFLIVGNQNAITYREIFPLIKNNKVWLGYNNGHFWFKVPDYYEEKATDFKVDKHGQKWRRMGNICWFTNLDIEKRHEEMILYKKYNSSSYPHYDDYEAIEVSKTLEIPCNYNGLMGVPVTFMQYYNPEQFEIVALDDHRVEWRGHGPDLNGKSKYRRIIIRRKQTNEN